MLTLKRSVAGKYVVMDDDEEQVAGPMSKADAEAYIAGGTTSAPPVAPNEVAFVRDYERRLDADLRAKATERSEQVRNLLLADPELDEDAVNRMMRDIDPILAVGREGRRRERVPFAKPVKAA